MPSRPSCNGIVTEPEASYQNFSFDYKDFQYQLWCLVNVACSLRRALQVTRNLPPLTYPLSRLDVLLFSSGWTSFISL